MTDQQSNGRDESAEAPSSASGSDDVSPPEAPVHRGPPIVVADEILNERGEETAAVL